VQAGDIVARIVRGDEFLLDLIERQRRGVDDARSRRTMREQGLRHQRARIETHRAAGNEIAPAHGDQVRRARTRTDKVYGHGASPSAQVTGPTIIRGASRRVSGPPAASAAASATDGTPISSCTRSDLVMTRSPASINAACDTNTRRAPSAAAASTIPASSALASALAINPSALGASLHCAKACATAASISLVLAPR